MSYNLTEDQRKEMIQKLKAEGLVKLDIKSSFKSYLLTRDGDNVVFEDGLKPNQIIEMCVNRGVNHIIQNSKMSFDQKIRIMYPYLQKPIHFFEFQSNIFENPESCTHIEFKATDDRSILIAKVLNVLGITTITQSNEHIITSAEEMIMNAQLNAPKSGDFKQNHRMILVLERYQEHLALSVFDDYGTLNISKFMKKILSTMNLGMATAINYGTGGAGLGSSIIYSNAETLIMGVLPKRMTRVTSILPFKQRAKEREIEQKSIHIIDHL